MFGQQGEERKAKKKAREMRVNKMLKRLNSKGNKKISQSRDRELVENPVKFTVLDTWPEIHSPSISIFRQAFLCVH